MSGILARSMIRMSITAFYVLYAWFEQTTAAVVRDFLAIYGTRAAANGEATSGFCKNNIGRMKRPVSIAIEAANSFICLAASFRLYIFYCFVDIILFKRRLKVVLGYGICHRCNVKVCLSVYDYFCQKKREMPLAPIDSTKAGFLDIVVGYFKASSTSLGA